MATINAWKKVHPVCTRAAGFKRDSRRSGMMPGEKLNRLSRSTMYTGQDCIGRQPPLASTCNPSCSSFVPHPKTTFEVFLQPLSGFTQWIECDISTLVSTTSTGVVSALLAGQCRDTFPHHLQLSFGAVCPEAWCRRSEKTKWVAAHGKPPAT